MKSLITRFSLGLLLAAAFTAAQADGLLRVQQTVFGMDCAPCAYGLQKGLAKLPGATKVEVSLNDGKATVEFGPDSGATFAQVHGVIVHGGFTPREADVTVAGHVVSEGGDLFLAGSGSERYRLVVTQASASALKPGEAVTLEGTISAESASETTPSMTVEKVLSSAP